MNTYYVNGYIEGESMPAIEADLKAVAMGVLFGRNFQAEHAIDPDATGFQSGVANLKFELPFALSNIIDAATQTNEIGYSSKHRGVNEYSDRPYPKQGHLVVALAMNATEAANITKYLDSFKSFNWVWDQGLVSDTLVLYIGIVNSGKTTFDVPFDEISAVFYEIPSHRSNAMGIFSPAGTAAHLSLTATSPSGGSSSGGGFAG